MATPNIKIESLRSVDLNSLNTFRIDGVPVLPVKCTVNSVGGYYSERTADVFFEFVEDCRTFYLAAHRSILASDSEMFRQIFYKTQMGSIVKVCDTSLELFDLFLQSFYNHSVTLRIHQIDELTRLAFYYNANKCKQICIDYMKLLIEDNNIRMLHCLELALRHECVNIQRLCMAKILEYGHSLVNSREFFTFSWKVIETVFTVNFYGRDEFKLYKMCLNQAAYECNRDRLDASNPINVKNYLKKYLSIIRWRDLTAVNKIEIIMSNCVDFADVAKQCSDDDVETTTPNPERIPKKLSTSCTVSVIKIKDPMMSFHRMYGDDQTADLRLSFQNRSTVSLHSCILAVKGLSLAKAIYNGHWVGKWNIEFMKANAEFFKPFYGLPIIINIDTILAAAQFGQYFQIDEYKNMDTETLLGAALSADTVFQIHELATHFNYYEIINKCYTLFKSPTFVWPEALKTKSFYRCNPETIKFAFRCGMINVSIMIETVIQWANYQCQEQNLSPITCETIRSMIGDIYHWIPTERIEGEHILSKFNDIFCDNEKN